MSVRQTFALAAAALLLLPTARAQSPVPEPGKTIRLVVPYAAGGNVDISARAIAPGLSHALMQPVVVENKPGAGGLVAGEMVARAAPDGLTLFISSNGPVLHSPLIYGRPVYDWRRDFAAVGSVSFTPMVLIAAPSLAARTVGDLLAAARQRPGEISIATPGAGSTNHLAAELLQMNHDVKLNTVHYKGTAPALSDLLGGHVQLSFDQISAAMPLIRDGKVRALAVTTPQRLTSLPDVPTFEEAGVRGFEVATFVGLFAPAATPPATVERLNAALSSVVGSRAVAERFEAMGARARAMSPGDFTRYLENEDAVWIPVITKAGIQVK